MAKVENLEEEGKKKLHCLQTKIWQRVFLESQKVSGDRGMHATNQQTTSQNIHPPDSKVRY